MLPDNYLHCKGHLDSLLKRLRKNPKLLEEYDSIIKNQLKEGIVERVDENSGDAGKLHYSPHREVIREDKSTTKVRVVYDLSAKMKNCPSINECLEIGNCMLPKIFEVIVRFRSDIALTSDIKSAFLQIRVNEADRDFLRFLWIDDVRKEDPKTILLRFT